MGWFFLNVLKSLILFGVIFFWNKFITWAIRRNISLYKKRNTELIEKYPINKWSIKNEERIIKFGQYFFWFGFFLILIDLWTKK